MFWWFLSLHELRVRVNARLQGAYMDYKLRGRGRLGGFGVIYGVRVRGNRNYGVLVVKP